MQVARGRAQVRDVGPMSLTQGADPRYSPSEDLSGSRIAGLPELTSK